MVRVFWLLGLAWQLSACDKVHEIPRQIDLASFDWLGGTVFSSPDQVTMKEVHLDKGLMLGRDVVVEGSVVEFGRFSTYMVMSDETARLLVVLTDLDPKTALATLPVDMRRLKVLGAIENGKRGLPYIQAKALTPLQDEG